MYRLVSTGLLALSALSGCHARMGPRARAPRVRAAVPLSEVLLVPTARTVQRTRKEQRELGREIDARLDAETSAADIAYRLCQAGIPARVHALTRARVPERIRWPTLAARLRRTGHVVAVELPRAVGLHRLRLALAERLSLSLRPVHVRANRCARGTPPPRGRCVARAFPPPTSRAGLPLAPIGPATLSSQGARGDARVATMTSREQLRLTFPAGPITVTVAEGPAPPMPAPRVHVAATPSDLAAPRPPDRSGVVVGERTAGSSALPYRAYQLGSAGLTSDYFVSVRLEAQPSDGLPRVLVELDRKGAMMTSTPPWSGELALVRGPVVRAVAWMKAQGGGPVLSFEPVGPPKRLAAASRALQGLLTASLDRYYELAGQRTLRGPALPQPYCRMHHGVGFVLRRQAVSPSAGQRPRRHLRVSPWAWIGSEPLPLLRLQQAQLRLRLDEGPQGPMNRLAALLRRLVDEALLAQAARKAGLPLATVPAHWHGGGFIGPDDLAAAQLRRRQARAMLNKLGDRAQAWLQRARRAVRYADAARALLH